MKMKIRKIGFLFVALLVCSLSVFAGGKASFNDDYKIAAKESFEPSQSFKQSWEITYGESKRPVQILLRETKRGEEYIVRTNYFEVMYTNTSKGFGARPIKAGELIVPEELNNQVINFRQLDAQKMLSNTQLESDKALELIAGFLPELVNEKYKNILN